MRDDSELIEEYLSGDRRAVEELVKKYQRQIFAHQYRMTGNSEDAKDLTQMTFIKAVGSLKGFRGESSFRTWLYRIAVNTGLSYLNTRPDSVEYHDEITGREPGLLASMIKKEMQENVRNALGQLPSRQRLAVVLRVYDGLSCAETALAMGCTAGAVKAHYHLGVERLKSILKEKGYEIEP